MPFVFGRVVAFDECVLAQRFVALEVGGEDAVGLEIVRHAELLAVARADAEPIDRGGVDAGLHGGFLLVVLFAKEIRCEVVNFCLPEMLHGCVVAHVAMQGPEAGEIFGIVVGGDDHASVELCEVEEHHHSHAGFHVALAQLREHRVVVADKEFLVGVEGLGEVEVFEIVAERLAHGDGAGDFVGFVGLDGDGAADERDAEPFAHGSQQRGTQRAVNAAGNAQNQRLQLAC